MENLVCHCYLFYHICANSYRKMDSLDPHYHIKTVMIGITALGFVLARFSKLSSIYVGQMGSLHALNKQAVLFIAECHLNAENCSVQQAFNELFNCFFFYQAVFSAIDLKPSRLPHSLPCLICGNLHHLLSVQVSRFVLPQEERADRRGNSKVPRCLCALKLPALSDEEPLLRTVKFLRLCSCLQTPL